MTAEKKWYQTYISKGINNKLVLMGIVLFAVMAFCVLKLKQTKLKRRLIERKWECRLDSYKEAGLF